MMLTRYRTLGRSGLVVSPAALGTMTFGAERWGSGEDGSRAVFDAYVEAGGNFVDTADVYSSGRSEEMLSGFVAGAGLRQRMVIATKAGFARGKGHPHLGGNGAKNIRDSLEGSLRRLRTDYVDLFWVHAWDRVTPAEEVLDTLGSLVRAGSIRYFGLSNVPAWYAAKMATLAAVRGGPAPIALQYQYSMLDRDIEHEFLPLAGEFGLGLVPWSPLCGGFLTGKYARGQAGKDGPREPELPTGAAAGGDTVSDERLNGPNPFGDMLFTERNWRLLETLKAVALEAEAAPAVVALAWLAERPGVSSILLGASSPEQLEANIAALSHPLSPEHVARLDEASAPTVGNPYMIYTNTVNRMVFGGCEVEQHPLLA